MEFSFQKFKMNNWSFRNMEMFQDISWFQRLKRNSETLNCFSKDIWAKSIFQNQWMITRNCRYQRIRWTTDLLNWFCTKNNRKINFSEAMKITTNQQIEKFKRNIKALYCHGKAIWLNQSSRSNEEPRAISRFMILIKIPMHWIVWQKISWYNQSSRNNDWSQDMSNSEIQEKYGIINCLFKRDNGKINLPGAAIVHKKWKDVDESEGILN
jgi:hypothetical protein